MTRFLFLASALLVASTTGALAFELTSPDMANGGTIDRKHVYNAHGCDGSNLSPALRWTAPPAGVKSFAVLVRDTDARGGAGWRHWFVYDLPATTSGLPEGAGTHGENLPDGAAQVTNDFGVPGYDGPCPPGGESRIIIISPSMR